ncbi:MAG: UbiA family prenyltransferase [Phycisphaerales bacterium]|nr:UbiA family prenyltransferase [Phycisphaerales bacterium]
MSRFLMRILTAIQLTRLTIAFGAVSDIWFIILLTRAEPRYTHIHVHNLPIGLSLLAGAVLALGLFAHGAALNDLLDLQHDSAFSPDRPIPAGRIRIGQAVVITIGALLMAFLGASILGVWAVVLTLLMAAGLLFYNTAGKFIPAVGFTTIGLLYVVHMLIPNHELSFTLPLWLIMTHIMAISMAVHLLEEKRPRITTQTIVMTLIAWIFWSVVIIGAGIMSQGSLWPVGISPWAVVYPLVAVAGFLIVVQWKLKSVSPRAGAEKLRRYGAMWQSLYAAAWLLALGMVPEALGMGIFALVGFCGMTMIREAAGLTGRPVEFRS